MQEKISAVIICQNEEKKIADCVESVRWADEILIVDAFSKDNTIAICGKYTDRILQRQWTNYREQREFAISQAKYDWILFVDADERISPGLHNEIIQALNSENLLNGYSIPRRTYYNKKLLRNWSKSYTLRLFRKNAAKLDPDKNIHETVIVSGKTGKLKNYIDHYTYDDLNGYLSRFNRYTSALADQLYNKNKNIPTMLLVAGMIFEPPAEFIRRFFLKLGFLGGIPVFIMSVMSAAGKFVINVKYWEIKQSQKR